MFTKLPPSSFKEFLNLKTGKTSMRHIILKVEDFDDGACCVPVLHKLKTLNCIAAYESPGICNVNI